MNILYINHYAGGPKYGMEYRLYYLAREWVRAGHTVTIVAASYSHLHSRQPATTSAFTVEVIEDIRFVWCQTPAYSGNGLGRVLNIVSFLRRLGQSSEWLQDKPEMVIASSTYPADIWPARRLADRHGAKLVWEVHDLWPLSPMELGGMSKFHPFILWMQFAENVACRSADAVVSLLPFAGSHLIEHGMDPSKFFYVPNGVDPQEWVEGCDQAELPAMHSEALVRAREAKHLLVGYAGSHGVANALDSLLDSAALMRDAPVTWLLIGGGPEKARLVQRVRSENLVNVIMLDPVPKVLIPAILKSMDVLYVGHQRVPLYRFGISPNKIMDYMMSARPIICAIDAANDLVQEAGCGMTILPENPTELAKAVERMRLLSLAERDRMGMAGRSYVEKNHLYPFLANSFLKAITT